MSQEIIPGVSQGERERRGRVSSEKVIAIGYSLPFVSLAISEVKLGGRISLISPLLFSPAPQKGHATQNDRIKPASKRCALLRFDSHRAAKCGQLRYFPTSYQG